MFREGPEAVEDASGQMLEFIKSATKSAVRFVNIVAPFELLCRQSMDEVLREKDIGLRPMTVRAVCWEEKVIEL